MKYINKEIYSTMQTKLLSRRMNRYSIYFLLCLFLFMTGIQGVPYDTRPDFKNQFGNTTIVAHRESGVLGSSARLPCSIGGPGADHLSLVMWYKEGHVSPIYSYDVRNGMIKEGSHWMDRELLGERVKFVTHTDPALLILENTTLSDAGLYRCRADYSRNPTRNQIVNFTIIVPVEKVAILNKDGKHIRNYKLGPFNEGESVTITCLATGGEPPPEVSWWRDNILLDNSSVQLPGRRVENTLRLDALNRMHVNKVFTCRANNSALHPPLSSAVMLLIHLRPLWVRMRGDNRPLSANHTYELECEVAGAIPTPVITWWKGSSNVSASTTTTTPDGNITVSVLKFRPEVSDGGKYLSCRGQQPSIPDSGLEDGWKLVVYHVPIVSLELGSIVNYTVIREGLDVYFECNIKSNPWIYQIRWVYNEKMPNKYIPVVRMAEMSPTEMNLISIGAPTINKPSPINEYSFTLAIPVQWKISYYYTVDSTLQGQQLYNNMAEGVLVSNQSLVLQGVTRANSGTYTCVASNREGDGESNQVFLDVKFAPTCRPGQVTAYGVGRGEVVRIPCEVEANPTQVNYTWHVTTPSGAHEIPREHSHNEQLRSVLRYLPRTEADYGTLSCWGHNDVGSQIEPCIFQLIPAGLPDKLINCSITNITSLSFIIDCVEAYDGGLPQEFLIEVYDEHHKLVNTVTNKSPHFHVSGLDGGKLYKLMVFAFNKKGRSPPAVLREQTLQSPERRTAYLPGWFDLKPSWGVMVGAVAALSTCLLGATAALCCRARKQDDRPPPRVFQPPALQDAFDDRNEYNPDILTLERQVSPRQLRYQRC